MGKLFAALAQWLSSSSVPRRVEDGIAAYERRDYTTALHLWRQLADEGNADAQIELGRMYERGHGVPRDDSEALKWYRLAAEQGHAEGQYLLAGMCVPQDDAQAVSWYLRAAAQEHADAKKYLDQLREFDVESEDQLRLLAELGDAEAQYRLGLIYDTGLLGDVLPSDDGEAVNMVSTGG